MCNCIQETEQRFKEHLRNNDPTFKDMEEFEVSFQNKAYMFGSGKTVIGLPCKISWIHITKKRRMMRKTKTQNFTMDYCPFCGEKQSKESAINE